MIPAGTIHFYSRFNNELCQKRYCTKEGRTRMINEFLAERLGKKTGAYYQIVPHTRIVAYQKKVIPDAPKKEIERPAAVYSNSKIYKYE